MRKMYYASIALYISAAITILLSSGGKVVIGEVIVFGMSLQANRTWAELLGILLWAFMPEIIVLAVQCICRKQKKSYGMFLVNTFMWLFREVVSPAFIFAVGGMLLIGIPGIVGGNLWGKGLLWLAAVHMVGYVVYNMVSGLRKEMKEIRLLIQEEECLYE